MSKLDDIVQQIPFVTLGGRWEQEYKQQIKDLMFELIGDDDEGMQSKVTPTPNGVIIDEWGDISASFKNKLRAELRQKVNDL